MSLVDDKIEMFKKIHRDTLQGYSDAWGIANSMTDIAEEMIRQLGGSRSAEDAAYYLQQAADDIRELAKGLNSAAEGMDAYINNSLQG